MMDNYNDDHGIETGGVKNPRLLDVIDGNGEDCSASHSKKELLGMAESTDEYASDQEFLELVESAELDLQMNKVFTEESRCCSIDQLIVPALPDDAIYEIFNKIPDKDQPTFLECRLVCTQWNKLIKNTSNLMRNITFLIKHSKEFLDLQIVQERKVKVICFTNCTPLETEFSQQFFDAISNTVEKVKFRFKLEENSFRYNQLFKLVLEKCMNLQELIIEVLIKDNRLVDFEHRIFHGITSATQIAAAKKIQILSVDLIGLREEDAKGLAELLLKLPQLREITFAGVAWRYLQIFKGLCGYLKKYDKAVYLKKLSFQNYERVELDHREMFTLLLILCGKHHIVIEPFPSINFNYLLGLKETETLTHQALSQRPLFSYKVNNSMIKLGQMSEEELANVGRLHGLTVVDLNLVFIRDIAHGELSWIKQIRGLESLTLIKQENYALPQQQKTLTRDSIPEFQQAFTDGLTSLKTLQIYCDIFNSIRVVFRWSEYFPNLTELEFNECEATPNYLITDLLVLQKLSTLKFTNLPNLKDIAFTVQCTNRFAKKGEYSLAPAIACFQSLKVLNIIYCPGLTNKCVVDGISKCKTLEELTIRKCEHVKKSCRRDMAQSGCK